jgi:hypothetical protein
MTYQKLTERTASFQLLRTNPKLTTNLKLTLDSSNGLWFNSIEANEQLANQKYKRFPIDASSNHEINVHKFYDNGRTPTSIAYSVGSTIGKNAVAKDLKDQYDFDLYTSGAKYLSSKQYSEKFAYFAPLYLDKILPTKFVIFKIPGASNYSAGVGRDTIPNVSIQDFATSLFENAMVVKVFDLSSSSNIGRYINNIVSGPMFTESPLYVNYQPNGYSLYRGTSISSGTYVEIPELHSTIFSRALPQLKLEQFITLGFERNGIVHPRILNMEFLFNDDTSQPYEFNRYFGFYCNDIDLANFKIDIDAMYVDGSLDNDQPLPARYQQSDDISFSLTNPNGIQLRGKDLSSSLTDISLNRTDGDHLFFPYLKTKDQNIHLIRPNSWNQIGSNVKFSLDDTSFDVGQTFGPSTLITQEVINSISKVDTRSTVSIEVLAAPQHLDALRIYHPSGSHTDSLDSHNRYDDLVFVSDSYSSTFSAPPIFTQGESYILNYASSESVIYINSDKSLFEIAQAICDISARFENASIMGVRMKNLAFLQVIKLGDTYGELKIKSLEASSSTPKFKLNNLITNEVVYADGGFLSTPHPLIDSGNISKLPAISDIVVRTNTNWSQVSRVSHSTDLIRPKLSDPDQNSAISNFNSLAVLMLTDNEIVSIDHDKVEIRQLYSPSVGVLSIFETKDFNFSTYTSDYVRTLTLDLVKDFYIPAETSVLDFTKYSYQIIGSGDISVNGKLYASSDVAASGARKLVWQNTEIPSKYSIVNGDAILIISRKYPGSTDDPNDSSQPDRIDVGYYDESGDSVNYVGPFTIKAEHAAPDKTGITYPYRDKYSYGNVSSEYQVYLENFVKDFASDGRVVPYINKWGLINSLDSRGNPYRLNTDILFGKDNFGPSHRETSPTPEKMTHEWFYIESKFDYVKDINLIRKNYCYFDESLSVSSLINDSAYFDQYFTYVPKLNGLQVDRPQYRYSELYKNEFTKQYETVFKGAMFRFYELDESQKPLPNTDRFKDYKFSVILKPVAETPGKITQPVKYRVIENTDSQSITVLIELVIGSRQELLHGVYQTGWSVNFDIDEEDSTNDDLITQVRLFRYNLFESITGDYRISFDDSGVSNLTHSFLYYAKNKKYNNKAKAFSTIKLSRGIDFSANGFFTGSSFANSIRLNGLQGYDSFANSEINQVSTQFAPIYVISGGIGQVLIQTSSASLTIDDLGNSSKTADGVDGATHDTIKLTPLTSGVSFKLVSPFSLYSYSGSPVPAGATSTWSNSEQFQVFGGVNYFSKVFENLSFAKFIELLDKNQSIISWESYTGGILSSRKKIAIEIIEADTIDKSTMVEVSQDLVRSGQINGIAGFTLNEVGTTPYQVNRYSGEYDVIVKPLAGYKYDFSINDITLTGSNSCINPNVDQFFAIPDFEHVKYSKTSILDLENSQNYSPVYPLIDETPINRSNFNTLSSSWDYNYHFEYSTKNASTRVAGTKRVTEDYSFVSKLLNLPTDLLIESFTSSELSNKDYLSSTVSDVNLVHSTFNNEVRFKLNTYDLIAKFLSDNGLRAEFQKFFRYSDGSQIIKDSDILGDLAFEQYLYQYCLSNLVKLYQIDSFDFYELDDRTIQGNLVQFTQVAYPSLASLGYTLVRTVKINNTKSGIVEGSVLIKPNTGVKLVPKIKIKFI